MKRKDAIKTLKELWRETNDPWYEEVYNMAINALEADRKDEPQTCDNCRFDSRYGIESICTECSRHYSDCYAPKPNCNECETYWNCQGQCDEIPQIEDEWQIEKRR